MRPYSDIEKHIISDLTNQDKPVFRLLDFIKPVWDFGKFEISSFQQKLLIYTSKEQVEAVMSYLLEVLDLISYLEKRGYVSSWEAFPMSDNTEVCGTSDVDVEGQFLPDLSVASKLLTLANRKYKINHSLDDLVQRNFQSTRKREGNVLKAILITGFVLLIGVSSLNLYMNYRVIKEGIEVEMKQIRKENAAVIKNQELSQVILDTLTNQSEQLMEVTSRTSVNTENVKELEKMIRQQAQHLEYMRRGQNTLAAIISKNGQILKKTDSLLNKTLDN